MSHSNLSIILLLSLFFSYFPSLTSSFNISQILSQYPAYSSFSNYFAQTQLADDMQKHLPVTVLVVNNSGISPLSGKPMDIIKELLSIHILLDYYDVQKFHDLHGGFAIVTTLYQATGFASGQVGFLNISSQTTGVVTFTSPSDDSGSVGATLVKSVASEPYNLSIVEISTVVMPPAVLSTSPPPSSSPKPAVPVVSPVPVISPVPVRVPVPVPVPVPVRSPVPVISPVPVWTPVPVISPVPVMSPVPVISPVPVLTPVPVASPFPMISMAPGPSLVMDLPADGPPAQSGVMANSGINMGLAFMVILLWTIFRQ